MDKHIVSRSLERIQDEMGSVDEEIAVAIRGELAVIRCEINKAPDPPVMDLLRGGMGLAIEPGKKYLIFADAALVHSEDIQNLCWSDVPGLTIAFCYPPHPCKLKDAVLVFDISKPTMFFVHDGAMDKLAMPDVDGVRFAFVSGPLAGKVQKQDSQVDAMLQRVLDICDEPMWVDGGAIAERIREDL